MPLRRISEREVYLEEHPGVAVHSPTRCLNCGHEEAVHAPEVGCMEPGGTQHIETEEGKRLRVCSCGAFVPVGDYNPNQGHAQTLERLSNE